MSKSLVGEPVDRFDGTFGLTFDITVENTGDIVLSGVQAVDDLSVVFAEPVEFEVTGISSADLTVNPNCDGGADSALLLGTDELVVGATGTVTVEVIVSSNGEVGPFENQASASGTSPAGNLVSDLSQDGADVDPDGDGDPTNDNEPMVFSLPELGALTGIVWYDLQADGESVGEEQLSGIRVVLVMRGPDGELGTDDDVEREDYTGSPYLFEYLPAGEGEVYVDTSTLPEFLRQTFDLDGSLDHRTRAFVVAGQTTEHVDFGFVEEIDVAVVKIGPNSTITSARTLTARSPCPTSVTSRSGAAWWSPTTCRPGSERCRPREQVSRAPPRPSWWSMRDPGRYRPRRPGDADPHHSGGVGNRHHQRSDGDGPGSAVRGQPGQQNLERRHHGGSPGAEAPGLHRAEPQPAGRSGGRDGAGRSCAALTGRPAPPAHLRSVV